MDNQTVGVDLDEESREQKVCIHPLATRPVLYTDTVGGNQACRDDLWAVTTDELNDLARRAEPSVAAGDERALFEQYALAGDYWPGEAFERNGEGMYIDDDVHAAFVHWRAGRRAALGSPAVSQKAITFDDGSTFEITGWAGGADPKGEFSTIMCRHRNPNGDAEVFKYVREPAVSQKATPVWTSFHDALPPDNTPIFWRQGEYTGSGFFCAEDVDQWLPAYWMLPPPASATQQAVSQMGGAAEQPSHETIVRECSNLVCTWCGTTAATTASASIENESELQFNATRLRNVARLVGMESAIPRDDATLDGARGSVLGMIAGKLRTIVAQQGAARVPSLDAILNCYSPDDTASDYQDKIREIYASHAANADKDVERDAARWRWFVQHGFFWRGAHCIQTCWPRHGEIGAPNPDIGKAKIINAAIDAAIASSAAQEGK